ncbi:MAG TPA: sugar isomerase [Solibacterales bacterium]|nr:sugar isomerase [Bryobacterales bacterium]
MPVNTPLRVRPVLTYEIPKKRDGTSYRQWGAIQTAQDVAEERERIGRELSALQQQAGFPLTFEPLEAIQTVEEASKIAAGSQDITITYAAGGGVRLQEALAAPSRWNLMFLRHRSGPVYLWYEIAHPRFLRKTVDEYGHPGMTVKDVIVDDQGEIAYKLRALQALKNSLGKKIVTVGGASGWGEGGKQAPRIAATDWKLEFQNVTYEDLGRRIKEARADDTRVRRCSAEAEQYLRQRGVTLDTSRDFVHKAFLLTDIFRDLMTEAKTDAITINQCMGTIMKVSETTACLPLSMLNDAGYMAFCESDFVVIPSGILLRYLAQKPVFLNDPTHPHHGMVTLAHCTAPRKMDGRNAEPVRIMTHFESDYGAAPKVEMRKGARLTNLAPDFANKRWVGFAGEVIDNPFLAICRSQIDVRILGNADKLLEEMKGFHWMTSYGEHLKEAQYALGKIGVNLEIV